MKKKNLPYRAFLFLVLAFLVVPFAIVSAQQPTPSDDEVNAIAQDLYCPICENTPLDVCPTEACHDWRELIRQMLAEGKTSNEIKQYFVDHYGARVLSEPPLAGFGWLAYVVPPVAILIGAVLFFRAFRKWRQLSRKTTNKAVADHETRSDDEYSARLEQELRKRNQG
jgi:cytochrome c-type biogenesis protein CcmH